MKTDEKEKMELTHKPVKGYPVIFYITVGIAVIYLAVVFINSL